MDWCGTGAQRDIFRTGRRGLSLAGLSHLPISTLRPVAGLDGEITVFDSRAHVSQIRRLHRRSHVRAPRDLPGVDPGEPMGGRPGTSFRIQLSGAGGFVRHMAQRRASTWKHPFLSDERDTPPACMAQRDRTLGQPITADSFRRSKQPYV